MSYFSVDKVPAGPGVYVLFEHDRPMLVNSTASLRGLAEQYIARGGQPSQEVRDAIPHPERITEISWWQHPAMEDENRRKAAQSVAIEALAPAFRPRFTLSGLGEVALADPEFVKSMHALFRGPPHGSFVPQSLHDLARSVYELKDKVAALERQLAAKKSG
jgi:hypothetical protein